MLREAEAASRVGEDPPLEPVYGYVEPLSFQAMGPPEPKTHEWFWSDAAEMGPTGVAQRAAFGGARLVQSLEGMG